VLVLGDAILDAYLDGRVERLSREAPVPVLSLAERRDAPGGAANAAANVAGLGGSPALLAVVGDDDAGARLRRELSGAAVSDEHLVVGDGRETAAKQRIAGDGQMLVRLDQGGDAPLGREDEVRLVDALRALHAGCDAILVSDYEGGVVSARVLDALAELQAAAPRVLVVDARRPGRYRAIAPTAVKPNVREALELLGAPDPGPEPGARARLLSAAGAELLERTGAATVAVTLDRDGALVIEPGASPYRTFARPARDTRATGAGDTFSAALALALAAGAPPRAAAELGAAAATAVVSREGTSVCGAGELRRAVSIEGKLVRGLEELDARLAPTRARGGRVVLANGCFDLLHRGHVDLLRRARGLGDLLVVAVNSDDSVRRLKGAGRPLTPLADRLAVLAAIDAVDVLVPFAGDTPVEVIRAARPDFLVKGGDHDPATLPEAPLVEELGGAVRILPLVHDHSTSGLIERARGRELPAHAGR
jgi:D-beta-D-heptose 7-phosphate kinase/D-beta-D-heptose 1-phosphate adenosyltransferase